MKVRDPVTNRLTKVEQRFDNISTDLPGLGRFDGELRVGCLDRLPPTLSADKEEVGVLEMCAGCDPGDLRNVIQPHYAVTGYRGNVLVQGDERLDLLPKRERAQISPSVTDDPARSTSIREPHQGAIVDGIEQRSTWKRRRCQGDIQVRSSICVGDHCIIPVVPAPERTLENTACTLLLGSLASAATVCG